MSTGLCRPGTRVKTNLALGKGLAVSVTALASRARGEERSQQAARIIRSVLPLDLIILLPFVGSAAETLQAMEYFFGGVLPCWFDTDGLLMQKVLDKPARPERGKASGHNEV